MATHGSNESVFFSSNRSTSFFINKFCTCSSKGSPTSSLYATDNQHAPTDNDQSCVNNFDTSQGYRDKIGSKTAVKLPPIQISSKQTSNSQVTTNSSSIKAHTLLFLLPPS